MNSRTPNEVPVSASKTWTEAEAEALVNQFDTTERSSRPLSGRELVQTQLMPSIKKKLKAGWSYDEIRDALAKLGVHIAKSTLKGYVKQSMRSSDVIKKSSSRRSSKSSNPTDPEAVPRHHPIQQTKDAQVDPEAENQTAHHPKSGQTQSLPTLLNDEV